MKSDLSVTVEELLADDVARQQQTKVTRQQMADTCAAGWNTVHTAVGSFADEHSTL